jgi:hypothetical protein
MSEHPKANKHIDSVTGGRGKDDQDPALEHRDTAHGQERETNEIEVRRQEPGKHGPTTHDDTRIDRKGG